MKTRVILASALLLFLGCVSPGPFIWVQAMPEAAFQPVAYRLQDGDLLYVHVWNQPKLTRDALVRPDGHITLPLVGDVAVEGLTPAGCGEEIARRLDGIVVEPQVAVSIKTSRASMVSVIGEVKRVGEYKLERNDTVLQMIARAGGMTEFASDDGVYLLRRDLEPRRVRFSYLALSRGEGRSLAFRLEDGDVIVVE